MNTLVEKEFTITNPCECDVNFFLVATKEQETKHCDLALDDSELEIFQKSKMIPARSEQRISLRICLKREETVKFKVFYSLDCISYLSNSI